MSLFKASNLSPWLYDLSTRSTLEGTVEPWHTQHTQISKLIEKNPNCHQWFLSRLQMLHFVGSLGKYFYFLQKFMCKSSEKFSSAPRKVKKFEVQISFAKRSIQQMQQASPFLTQCAMPTFKVFLYFCIFVFL